ncbi:hypothetical protein GUJ93_ZPchr0001g31045 [Zizania palustris]|uniref:Glucose-induced degradation protein 4 homolog n=1 Tax=Zizania palustris TaxID=103762 RepID=A0A8J5SA38_ZIZPA|nr:hypothetical protein GUJ93_ZPchr0001g31045 [Zizania palustris]
MINYETRTKRSKTNESHTVLCEVIASFGADPALELPDFVHGRARMDPNSRAFGRSRQGKKMESLWTYPKVGNSSNDQIFIRVGIVALIGYLCGTMEALNVPLADTPVVTFWEGEIVDAKNYTFFTGNPEDDIRHWSKFPSFTPLLSQIETDGGKSLDLSNYAYIFMRWKEQYFVNVGVDCGLTIAGFYYVCFSCSDGSISGFYYDPNSSPFQKLELKCTNEKNSGFTFSSYELQ